MILSNWLNILRFFFFADDLKLFIRVREVEDCQILQHDLQNIVQWSEVNNLPLNINKCKAMTFTRSPNITHYNYMIKDVNLQSVSNYTDLGVLFDQKLSFNDHVMFIVKKARKTLGFVYRNCKDFSTTKPLDTLYNSYVRSTLEYCSLIWSPYYLKYQLVIERVQFKYLRSISHMTS